MFDLELTYVDGRTESAKALPVDLVAFERKFKCGSDVLESPHFEYLTWLAWNVLRRTQRTSEDYDAWLATLAGIETPDEDDEEAGEGGAPLLQRSDS